MGQGAFQISRQATRNASASGQRNNRKVSGGAYGNPNFATINPVLHSKTKKNGVGEKKVAVWRAATLFVGMFDLNQ